MCGGSVAARMDGECARNADGGRGAAAAALGGLTEVPVVCRRATSVPWVAAESPFSFSKSGAGADAAL